VAGIVFSLQFKPVQTFVAKKAARFLSKELKNTTSIGSIYIIPFKSIVLEDLVVLDLDKDTLANFPSFTVDIKEFSTKNRIVKINSLKIKNGSFYLKDQVDGSSNLDFIIDYFDTPVPKTKIKKKKYQITFNKIVLDHLKFKYRNLKIDTPVNGVNYDDIEVQKLSGVFENLNTATHLFQTQIKNLTLKEKSGFYLKNLTALTTIDTNAVKLQNMLLLTGKTRLNGDYQMNFKKFKDFNNYVKKVKMVARFKNSFISSKDVAFFAPEIKKMNLDIFVNGQISGYVNDLKAKNLAIKAGKATYIKGNFNMKGLPYWKDTFMSMKVEMAGTNKKDLEQIIADITGNNNQKLPALIQKFGNVNFSGSFTGFQNDFIAFGEFKTQLGRFISDVNMKIDQKETPSYTGSLKTFDFNLGVLIDEKSIGKISSELYVKGKGTKLNDLKETLNGNVSYFDFNGYRYQNIKVNGTFEKKFFDGNLTINDKNIQLDFAGNVNLNPKLPIFNFKVDLKNAKLNLLKLYKDTLQVDAMLSSNFSGKNLNDIQGSLVAENIKISNNRASHQIKLIQLNANNLGLNRSLIVKSDLFDASILGQYDLNSMVSYYKAIAKTYLPALTKDVVNYKTQIFDFNLSIKNFEPIADIFVPGLKIDNQAILIGSFDSRNNKATLNGSINQLTYRGITAKNIIIDENTTAKALTAIITADRVDLNDSLYIKNVNIANVLKNDSLAVNIKLSDAEDANQLDLNGLVAFAGDSKTKINILPSSLKINNENWNIQEKVQISLNDGKAEINNFALSNQKQLVRIDGFVSKNPKDILTIGFENFNLSTLNPFLKTLDLTLAGNVNGKTKLFNLLNSTQFSDSLQIKGLSLNNVTIGDLTDTSSYQDDRKTANIYTQILTDGKETLKATGKLDFETENIDLNIKLDETKTAVIGPFLKTLVSDLKGTLSADLSAKGNFSKPEFNGQIKFNNSILTVNYLKTTYLLNDLVDVKNTTIALNDFELKDLENNLAIANGFVDLNNINNPTIDVKLVAKSFMALNTTSKDNAVFFGKAFASGNFSFKGPTDNMFIDIDARTEKGTVFNLPLNSSETISDKDFISFVSKDTTQVVKRNNRFNGLTMNFKLKVDPNSTANIFTELGKLSGKGNAELELGIKSSGDFEMKGDYIIESGVFDFTAQEVINKRFEIRQGGSIRWTGNPTTAQINLKAVYALRTNLKDLYAAANRDQANNTNESLLTEVEMGLGGLLLKPEIKLDIFFPANPAKKDEFQSYFNDGNNLDRQALSLIIQRRFAPGTGSENIGQQLGSVGRNTAQELIFNQFNNLLSSLNLNFVDFNFRSLSEASASFKFFNDRIILNAGLVNNNSNTTDFTPSLFGNNVGREVEILGLIKKDGTLTGKLANKPPTRQSVFANPGVDPNVNVTSLGIVYSQQFDTFSEFIKKITGKYKKEQQQKEAQQAKDKLNKDALLNESKKNPKR